MLIFDVLVWCGSIRRGIIVIHGENKTKIVEGENNEEKGKKGKKSGFTSFRRIFVVMNEGEIKVLQDRLLHVVVWRYGMWIHNSRKWVIKLEVSRNLAMVYGELTMFFGCGCQFLGMWRLFLGISWWFLKVDGSFFGWWQWFLGLWWQFLDDESGLWKSWLRLLVEQMNICWGRWESCSDEREKEWEMSVKICFLDILKEMNITVIVKSPINEWHIARTEIYGKMANLERVDLEQKNICKTLIIEIDY